MPDTAYVATHAARRLALKALMGVSYWFEASAIRVEALARRVGDVEGGAREAVLYFRGIGRWGTYPRVAR
jgi:hypothetical protein